MAIPGRRKPLNLTALTEMKNLRELCTAGEAGCTLEVCGLEEAGTVQADGLPGDTVYVVASGYGVLHHDGEALECTAGDVIFVPSGQPHRFERLEAGIRVWRISAMRREAGLAG